MGFKLEYSLTAVISQKAKLHNKGIDTTDSEKNIVTHCILKFSS